MNDLILKRVAVLILSLFFLIVVPEVSFAQIIYGFDQASTFNTTHPGTFSIYAGSFRSEVFAKQLRDKIAPHTHYPVYVISTHQWHSVVLGPIPSAAAVRTTGSSLLFSLALKSSKTNKVSALTHGRSQHQLDSSPLITSRQGDTLLPHTHSSRSGMKVTVLVGGGSSAFDKQGQVVFPAMTYRTDSFAAAGAKIDFASAIALSYDKILGSNKVNASNILRSIAIGVNAYYNESSRNGSVYEYSLPDFNNSTYNMTVKSYRVMLDTEWVLHPLYFGIMPFIQAGLGGAQNTMGFKNIPRPNIGADGGNYSLSNYSSVHFAYELGAGLNMPLSTSFLVSVRYLFADSGNAKSGTSDNATGVVLATPVTTTVQSQSVLFGLSYLFG